MSAVGRPRTSRRDSARRLGRQRGWVNISTSRRRSSSTRTRCRPWCRSLSCAARHRWSGVAPAAGRPPRCGADRAPAVGRRSSATRGSAGTPSAGQVRWPPRRHRPGRPRPGRGDGTGRAAGRRAGPTPHGRPGPAPRRPPASALRASTSTVERTCMSYDGRSRADRAPHQVGGPTGRARRAPRPPRRRGRRSAGPAAATRRTIVASRDRSAPHPTGSRRRRGPRRRRRRCRTRPIAPLLLGPCAAPRLLARRLPISRTRYFMTASSLARRWARPARRRPVPR